MTQDQNALARQKPKAASNEWSGHRRSDGVQVLRDSRYGNRNLVVENAAGQVLRGADGQDRRFGSLETAQRAADKAWPLGGAAATTALPVPTQWLNKALLAQRNEFNEFTEELRRRCMASGSCLVKMRNGSFEEVVYQPPNEKDGQDDPLFRTKDGWRLLWDADGSSVKNSDLDLIELK